MKRLVRTAFILLFVAHGRLWAQSGTQPPPAIPVQSPPYAPEGTPVTRTRIPTRLNQAVNFEAWRVEVTAGYWPLHASGEVKTQTTPADLKKDLGIVGFKSHPYA